jgi:hypothetical protein
MHPLYGTTLTRHIQVYKIEAVQRRAARFIMGDYKRESSVTSMLKQLDLDTLQSRRQAARATMMYRVVNDLIDIPSSQSQPTISNIRGYTSRYLQPFCHTKSYQDSFFPAGIVIWNSLPASKVTADSLEVFKARISQHSF